MNDLEIEQKCAEKMGYGDSSPLNGGGVWLEHNSNELWTRLYNPLNDDAQAMALVKKFELFISKDEWDEGKTVWLVSGMPHTEESIVGNADLNRAICECVARMP